MRLTTIILITVLAAGSIIISLGFLTSEEYIDVPEISSQYEKLERYKNELEKINEHNYQMLEDLQRQITDSNNAHLAQINEEIKVINRVIEQNKAELEQVIAKLSQMDSPP